MPSDDTDLKFPLLVFESGDPCRLEWCTTAGQFVELFGQYDEIQMKSLLIWDARSRAVVATINRSASEVSVSLAMGECGCPTKAHELFASYIRSLNLQLEPSTDEPPVELARRIFVSQLERLRRGRFMPLLIMLITFVVGGSLTLPFSGSVRTIGVCIIVLGWTLAAVAGFRVLRLRCPCCTLPFFTRGHLFGFTNTLTRTCLRCGLPLRWKEPFPCDVPRADS